MKNNLIKTGIFTAAIFFTMNITAQDKKGGKKGGGSPEKILERLDLDTDGKLSLEEVSNAKKGKLAENFEAIDVNTDGFLDAAELKAHFDARPKRKKQQ